MGDWLGIGTAAGGAVGAGLNLIGQKKREERAVGNQMKLNKQGRALGMQTWHETNVGPQMQKMREAGLNPALMYGKGGAGGGTVGSPSGGSAPAPQAMDIGNQVQGGIQLALQKKAVDAEVDLKGAQADKLRGVDTAKGEAETSSLLQGIENAKAQQNLLEAQKIAVDLGNKLAGQSIDEQLNILKWTGSKLEREADIAGSQAYVDSKTMDSKVEILKAEAYSSWLEVELKKANIAKTKEETMAIAEGLLQTWKGLEIQGQNVDVNKFREEVKLNYPSIMNSAGRLADHSIDAFLSLFGRSRPAKKMK